jgi:anaphase-promoting complex subunit 1
MLDVRDTVVESRLALGRLGRSWNIDELRELRGVFEWAELQSRKDGKLRWLGTSVVEGLRAAVLGRGRAIGGE